MIVIMTQDKYDEKLAAAQAEGRRLEKREWERREDERRRQEHEVRSAEVERQGAKFSGKGITILLIEQILSAWERVQYDYKTETNCDGEGIWRPALALSFKPPLYRVKFRTNGGIESETTVSFDTPDFSIQDVRKEVQRKLCG